jgi:hypothetical protein
MAARKTPKKSGSKAMKPKAAGPQAPSAERGKLRLYTLDVFLIGGYSRKFGKKKRQAISRAIQIRGDQTLEDLHEAIFAAYDRYDEHLYEFQFGKGPMDPNGRKYGLALSADFDVDMGDRPAGRVDLATLDSLGLTTTSQFGYWFDFGDDWWHQINVEAIDEEVPPGKFPRVTKRVGDSPPQYPPDEDDEGEEEDDE